jgi:hypothetical protein
MIAEDVGQAPVFSIPSKCKPSNRTIYRSNYPCISRDEQEEAGSGPSTHTDQHDQSGVDLPESRPVGCSGGAGRASANAARSRGCMRRRAGSYLICEHNQKCLLRAHCENPLHYFPIQLFNLVSDFALRSLLIAHIHRPNRLRMPGLKPPHPHKERNRNQ